MDNNMEEDIFDNGGFMVNYSEVVKSKESLAVTRLLAADLMASPYMLIGDWFKNLSQADLEMLVDIADSDDQNNYEDLILIAEMLARAEGLSPAENMDEMSNRIKRMVVILVGEQLFRKGLIKMYHQNISFGEDEGDKIVMEKL
jgi:hypothetical protein